MVGHSFEDRTRCQAASNWDLQHFKNNLVFEGDALAVCSATLRIVFLWTRPTNIVGTRDNLDNRVVRKGSRLATGHIRNELVTVAKPSEPKQAENMMASKPNYHFQRRVPVATAEASATLSASTPTNGATPHSHATSHGEPFPTMAVSAASHATPHQ